MQNNVKQHLDDLIARYPALTVCADDIAAAYEMLYTCYQNGGKLLACGNGGSAADSEHIVGELMKGFMLPRRLHASARAEIARAAGGDADFIADSLQGALPAISLVSHTALSTAFANDVAPDMVFAQQVYGYAKPGDVLIGISTSGNSKNVLYAAKVAKARGAGVIAMTGQNGGLLASVCDVTIQAPTSSTPEVQEYHLPVYHTLCMMVETAFFG